MQLSVVIYLVRILGLGCMLPQARCLRTSQSLLAICTALHFHFEQLRLACAVAIVCAGNYRSSTHSIQDKTCIWPSISRVLCSTSSSMIHLLLTVMTLKSSSRTNAL